MRALRKGAGTVSGIVNSGWAELTRSSQRVNLIVCIKSLLIYRQAFSAAARMPRWFIRTGCGEQADLAGGDRASAVGSRSGRSTSFESAWPRPRSRHKLLDPVPRMRGSIHDWPARRVVCGVSARVSLECTPCGFVIAFDGIRSCARSPNITILYKVLPALIQKDNTYLIEISSRTRRVK